MSEDVESPRDNAHWLLTAIHARRGALTALAILAVLGIGAKALWGVVGPRVAHGDRYTVTPGSVSITTPPAWVRGDLVAQAFEAGGLGGRLSVLDPPEQLEQPLAEALAAHPWVRRVTAVQKAPPNRVRLEVEYRTPLAAVASGADLLPVDAQAALLPRGDLSTDQLRWMPRVEIAGPPTTPPAVGDLWADARVAGAAALVEAFGPLWNQLDLFAIGVDATPQVRAGQRFWTYKLRSTGDTTILWGAAPGVGPADEAPFDTKLARLQGFITRHGPLDSVATSPQLLDVRDGVEAFRRVVLRDGNRVASQPEEEAAVVK